MILLGIAAVLLSPGGVAAWGAPDYAGLQLVWQDTFPGPAGEAPNAGWWNTITNIHVNNEWQRYTADSRNLQISGGNTIQIVPWHNPQTGEWTSARIESKYTFTPQPGTVTAAEALIRFGDNPIERKRGLWPAFWLLGDSIRRGTPWPQCGELDVLETVNGALLGYGTVHCDVYPGGRCAEPSGIGGTAPIPDQGWHSWRIQWDRRPGDWRAETVTWFIDGRQFFSIDGGRVGDEAVWQSLCHSPVYFILNMAVGGNFPGSPNGDTLDGYGSMLEVAYVAHYIGA